MCRFFLPILLSAFVLALPACAQVKNVVVRSEAFYLVPTPGTIQVDEAGEPVAAKRDSVFYLFIETASDKIEWQRAWKGNRSFSLISTKMATAAAEKKNGPAGDKTNRFSPQPGNTLWQLELADDGQRSAPPQPLNAPEILVSGNRAGKSFFVRTKSLSELASPIFP